MTDIDPLAPQTLRTRCDPAGLAFETTAELPESDEIFGQARAVEAVRFAIAIDGSGYNLFVLGEPGSNRHGIVRRLVGAHAATLPPPDDWCYINNFAQPNKPRSLRVPAGRGATLRAEMQRFVTELAAAISAGFESEEYRSRIEAIQDELKQREEHALGQLGDEAVAQGLAFLRTPQGFAFVPMKGEETLDPEAFANLPDDERARIGALIDEFRERLHKLSHQFPRWRREMQTRVREVGRDTMQLAVGHLIEELKERYTDLPAVLGFLDEVLRDVVEVGDELRGHEAAKGDPMSAAAGGGISAQRYQVNLLVGHGASDSAPLEFEDHPTYANLVGRVDHIAQLGTLVTNFTLVKPGALHRANGGYLMLDAVKVLTQPYAWEGLKRALKSRQIRVESLAEVLGWAGSQSLEPEPIPLSLKVILFGERAHYYLLKSLDPEFEELFKVAADFESVVDRNAANIDAYSRMVAGLVRAQSLRPLERAGVARLVEHGARLAGDAGKLSTRTREIADLLRESDHRAGIAQRAVVTRDDVDAALAARIRRADRLRDSMHDAVLRETVLISTAGTHTGQVNGLAIIDLGDFMFARPTRITATARLGDGDVIDIERKAELGGPLHSKGVMILSAFLAARYAQDLPLSLSASLVFEQSYGPVEGDSASLAELCALLSALAGVPIKQSLAVTGSVNQHGRVQPIGAVNEKVEGFFDICRARGLTGDQGVLIPSGNVKHLMLRDDVVAAAAAGQFHVFAVEDVDEAIELLTGIPAGVADAAGVMPRGTVNFRVEARLAELSAMRRDYGVNGRPRHHGDSDTGHRHAAARSVKRGV